MDASAILVKIAGLVLFFFTARSVYRHFKARAAKRGKPKPSDNKPEQSKVEHALNTFLLYAWFVFMTALSLGMVVNN
jgi:ABC-type Fe3+ transport system permease subunit